ncbi:MAG: hypothetical protein LOD92_07775, partial [Bacillales bacterium]
GPDVHRRVVSEHVVCHQPRNHVVKMFQLRKTAAQNDDIYYLDPEVWYLSGGGVISMNKMLDEIEASLE